MALAVLDIDGVVADVAHRVHHLDRRPKDWPAFFLAASDDRPLPTGVRLAQELAVEHDLVWLTGRPEWIRDLTADWLLAQGLPVTELLMRASRDHRPAELFKVGVLRRLAPRGIAAFVDDDVAVIKAARRAGVPAELADWAERGKQMRVAQNRLGRS